MTLHLDDLPVLIGPRRRAALTLASDRDRLGQIKLKRRKKKPGKAHATNQERSHAERQKAKASALQADKRSARLREYHAAVRAYWLGEQDGHPGTFKP